MEVKITKRTVLEQWSNSICDGEIILVQGRIYNDIGDHYRRFGFIVRFCCDDIWEFFQDGDEYDGSRTEAENENRFDRNYQKIRKEYIESCIDGYAAMINGYDNSGEFFRECAETVNEYNAEVKRRNRERIWNW